MSPKFLKAFYLACLIAWSTVFCVFAVQSARYYSDLRSSVEKAADIADRLNRNGAQLRSVVRMKQQDSLDLTFLQQLVDFIPESEGFLRTQKALFQDTQNLRSKIADRLRGRLHILVDTKANKLFVKEGVKLLWQADCSVGRGGTLQDKKTGRRWEFVTPRGKFRVGAKVANPVWRKPDWAFIENGETPPPPDDPRRKAAGELGAYVLSLGDGYLIHGTKNEASLGQAVSHGCVRLGAENLERLYQQVPVGTEVYIY